MKIAETYRDFLKIKRKFYKRNTIKRIDHINGKRFVSYWEHKDWVGFVINNQDKINKATISYIELMVGEEWYNEIENDVIFLLNNIGLDISVKWYDTEKTINGKFGGIVLTNMDVYYLIDDKLVSLYFRLEKK